MSRLAALLVLAIGCGDSVTPTLPGEFGGDGKPDRRGDSSPCSATSDYSGDGSIDYRWTYYYDDLGRSVQDSGRGLEGNPDEIDTYSWDNVDHLMSFVETLDGAEVWRMESTYDTLGDQVDTTITESYDPQSVTVDRTVNHDFDDHSRPAYAIQSYTGLPDLKMTFVYDDVGRMIERHDDESLDGTIDAVAFVVYDEVARTTTTTTTRADGAHALRTRRYDEALHLVSSRNDSYTRDGLLSTNEIAITWDGDRELSWMYTIDGAVSSVYAFSYSCAQRARRTRSTAVSD